MPSRILVAEDFSEASALALAEACARARADSAELAVCHVLPELENTHALFANGDSTAEAEISDLDQRARAMISQRLAELDGPASVHVFIDSGTAYAEIVRRAEAWSADLVVVGGHGRTGLPRLLLGSVAERVVRHAHAPVLVVRKSPRNECVLVATDLSDPSLPAVERGAREAERRGQKLVLVHAVDLSPGFMAPVANSFGSTVVVPPPEVQAQVREALARTLEQALERFNAKGEVRVLDGSPAAAVVHAAHELGAGLLVVGTHGRTGLSRIALGSVAERIIHAAECSVLAVRSLG